MTGRSVIVNLCRIVDILQVVIEIFEKIVNIISFTDTRIYMYASPKTNRDVTQLKK